MTEDAVAGHTSSLPRLSGYERAAILLLPAVAVLILYWPSLGLPLIYDDLLHIRIADELNLGTVWLPTEAFGFYRPLTFLPLLLIRQTFGDYPAWLLHGLNVVQHAIDAALLAWLAGRLWGKMAFSLATGLLFAFFPFSYQAVAVYGHNVHPTTTGLLLLAIHCYLSALDAQRPRPWWFLSGILYLLALLSHESAILFGPLAALVEWSKGGRQLELARRRPVALLGYVARLPWFVFSVIGLVYAVGYQFLPLSRAPQAGFGASATQLKASYLLQAASFPVAWLGRWFSNYSHAAVVVVAFLIPLGFSLWRFRRPAVRRPLLLGWSWWVLASILIAVPLPASYLLHGPRLLYLGSAGLGLLWAALLFPPGSRPDRKPALNMVIAGLVLALGAFMVRDRLTAYVRLSEPIVVAQEALDDRPPEEGLLLINLPQWVAPRQGLYPVGVELAAVLGDYLFVEEFTDHNLSRSRPVKSWVAPDLLVERDYNYGLRRGDVLPLESWASAGVHVVVSEMAQGGPRSRYTGFVGPAEGDNRPLAVFEVYELLEVRVFSCEGIVTLDGRWRPVQSWTQDNGNLATISIFAQLLDDDGRLLSQADGPLLGLRPDLLPVPASWELQDVRNLQATGSPSTQLLLGVYDFVTGQRFPGSNRDGQLPDDALRLTVSPCPK